MKIKIILAPHLYLRDLNMNDHLVFYELLQHNYHYFEQALLWIDKSLLMEQSLESLKLRVEMTKGDEHLPTWFAIVYNDQFCGMIGFNEIDDQNRIGELGYFIGEEFSSRGKMTRSLGAIIKYAFEKLQLNKIELYIDESQSASNRLAEKFNFKREGTIRAAQKIGHTYINHNLYRLLQAEY